MRSWNNAKRRLRYVHLENSLCAGIVGADPVHLAVRRSDLLLRLCIQAGKCAALPAGSSGADYLLRKERYHPLGDRASHKPPWIADAGGLDAWETARCKRGNKRISERIKIEKKRSASAGRFAMCRLQKNFSKTFKNFATNADKIVHIG